MRAFERFLARRARSVAGDAGPAAGAGELPFVALTSEDEATRETAMEVDAEEVGRRATGVPLPCPALPRPRSRSVPQILSPQLQSSLSSTLLSSSLSSL